jgi:hypothetical protein
VIAKTLIRFLPTSRQAPDPTRWTRLGSSQNAPIAEPEIEV